MNLTKADFLSIFNNFINISIFQFSSIVLQFVAVPLVIQKYGLEVFGEIAITSSFAVLIGSFINYGTNQTAIKDVAANRNDKVVLSNIVSKVLWLRISIFFIIFSIFITIVNYSTHQFYLWASVTPTLLAEIANPLYFLVGIEKIHWISWSNLLVRLFSVLMIYFIPIQSNHSIIINLYLGSPLLILYCFLFFYITSRGFIKIFKPNLCELMYQLKNNFYITFNGNSSLMQQSIFLFFLSGIVNPAVMGAYGVIDKMLSATRQIVSWFSISIYPKAVSFYISKPSFWYSFRYKLQITYTVVFTFIGLFLFFFSDQLTRLIDDNSNSLIKLYLQLFSFCPLLLALNANNLIDLLLRNKLKEMFYISLFILSFTVILSFIFTLYHQSILLGWYPLIIEGACLLIYSIFLRLWINAK